MMTVTHEAIERYAAAIGTPPGSGNTAPALFPVVATTDAFAACLASWLDDADPGSGAPALPVLTEADVTVDRPVRPGDELSAGSRVVATAADMAGTWLTVATAVHDGRGRPVADVTMTALFRGLRAAPPRQAPPGGARRRAGLVEVGRHTASPEQVALYAAVSGDSNPIHMSDDAARSIGLVGRVVHGMSLLATVAETAAAAFDGRRVGHIAARFRRPVPIGHELVVRCTPPIAGATERLSFEVSVATTTAIRDGALSLLPDPAPPLLGAPQRPARARPTRASATHAGPDKEDMCEHW
jgi:acyl dehydratase